MSLSPRSNRSVSICRAAFYDCCFSAFAILLVAIFILPLTTITTATAQPGIEDWRLYDGGLNNGEIFCDIYPRTGGGYFLCGRSVNCQAWVVRIDERGAVVWNRRYGLPPLQSVIEADNGDIVVCGPDFLMYQPGNFTAARINSDNGDLIWSHDCGPGYGDAVIELKEGDFVLAGAHYDEQSDHISGELNRIDSDGNQVWSRQYDAGQFGYQFLQTMRETEGGVVAAGIAWGADYAEGWIIKADLNGDQIWNHVLTPEHPQYFNSMVSMPGGFALAGPYSNDGHDRTCFTCLTFINADGELVSSNPIDVGDNRLTHCERTGKVGGGFCLVGGIREEYQNGPCALKTDRHGRLLWAADYRDHKPDNVRLLSLEHEFQSVIVRGDNQLAACGEFPSGDDARGDDGLVAKLEPDNSGQILYYRHPEDTLLTVLPGDPIRFVLWAHYQNGFTFNNQWAYGDSLLGRDTSQTVVFDTLAGDYPIICHLSDGEWVSDVRWLVRVRDLFIVDHTPDSLNLTIHRGATVNFSIDSVAATPGDTVNYAWTLRDIMSGEQQDAGEDAHATIEFRRSGDYTLEGYTYRGESSDAVTWNIAVRSTVLDFRPEQQTMTVPLDTTIAFEVIPFDPADTTLRYRWLVDGDSVGGDSSDSVRFTEEAGGQAGRLPYAVLAIVSDSSDADTIVWKVTVARPDDVRANWNSPLRGLGISLSPNPFNARSTVHFSLPAEASGTLTLRDLSGRTVRSLAAGRFTAGEHQLALDAAELAAGLYFLRLEAAGRVKIAKAVVMK